MATQKVTMATQTVTVATQTLTMATTKKTSFVLEFWPERLLKKNLHCMEWHHRGQNRILPNQYVLPHMEIYFKNFGWDVTLKEMQKKVPDGEVFTRIKVSCRAEKVYEIFGHFVNGNNVCHNHIVEHFRKTYDLKIEFFDRSA